MKEIVLFHRWKFSFQSMIAAGDPCANDESIPCVIISELPIATRMYAGPFYNAVPRMQSVTWQLLMKFEDFIAYFKKEVSIISTFEIKESNLLYFKLTNAKRTVIRELIAGK